MGRALIKRPQSSVTRAKQRRSLSAAAHTIGLPFQRASLHPTCICKTAVMECLFRKTGGIPRSRFARAA